MQWVWCKFEKSGARVSARFP